MRAMRILLVLIPVLAAAAMLAGILGSDRGFEIIWSVFLVALFAASGWAVWLFCCQATRKLGLPAGWQEAEELYPVSRPIEKPRIRGFVQENGRNRFFSCWLRFDDDGVFIKDGHPLFTFGKMFIPWEVLEGPEETDAPWYVRYARPGWEQFSVALSMRGTRLSLVISADTWSRDVAAHVAGNEDGSGAAEE